MENLFLLNVINEEHVVFKKLFISGINYKAENRIISFKILFKQAEF